jgi:hypothetical protein
MYVLCMFVIVCVFRQIKLIISEKRVSDNTENTSRVRHVAAAPSVFMCVSPPTGIVWLLDGRVVGIHGAYRPQP